MRGSEHWTTPRTAGLTLIEVVASLALLGSLLVSVVLARSRYVHQWRLAERKHEAVEAADALLRGWSGDWDAMPRDGENRIDNRMSWQTQTVPHETLAAFDAELVRLSIVDQADAGAPAVLTQVDVVVPVARRPAGDDDPAPRSSGP